MPRISFFKFLALWLLFILGGALSLAQGGPPLEKTVFHTQGGEHLYRLERADTPEDRGLGLMFRTHLAEDGGMIFVFPEFSLIRMWMKNTPLSLDLFFLDHNGVILKIVSATVPYSLTQIAGPKDARVVIELKAGEAIRMAARVGDRVEAEIFRSEGRHGD